MAPGKRNGIYLKTIMKNHKKYYHLLRRQMIRDYRKPGAVVMPNQFQLLAKDSELAVRCAPLKPIG